MPYLWDADAFIQAKNGHYRFSFCPAYWDWLIQKNTEGVVYSVQAVQTELQHGNDELAEWARARKGTFFFSPDNGTVTALSQVSQWVVQKGYPPAAISDFFTKADYFLIGQALALGYTIVTHEKSTTSLQKIKIPDVCAGLGVACSDPFQVLDAEGARFILG